MEHATPEHIPVLAWKALLRPHHKRGKMWFLVAGAIAISLLLYSIAIHAWSFAVVIVMFVFVFWFAHRDPPEERSIELFEDHFVFDGTSIEWKDCTGFWFLQGPGYHELHIQHQKKVLGEFVIQTGSVSVEQAHSAISRFLPELEDRKERLLDTISRICKI